MADEDLNARIDAAVELMIRIARGELDARGELSERGDNVDALVEGLNMLAEELEAEVTARERAEALLADERAAYEHAPGLLCSVEREGLTIIKCNQTLALSLGQPKEALIGRPFPSLCEPGERDGLERFLRGLTLGAPSRGRELTLNAGPQPLTVAARATRVSDAALGDRVRILMQDITERVALEAERDRLEEQQRQTQKMEAIGRLAGGVAHDFNNLLTAITLNAELALRGQKRGDPIQIHLEHIAAAAGHAAEITQQLLAFSRKQSARPRVIDLNALIARMHPMLARLIREDISLRTALGAAPCRVQADPGQLEQIVLNLVLNARDAMPEGGELRIETANRVLDERACARHPSATPGAFVTLSVHDTGCGMSPDTRERIFEPFFSSKTLGHGTGLGLATVFGVVQQNRGAIEVESEPGRGSTLRVYLPLVDAPEAIDAAPEPPERIGGRETILVVEDEEIVRQVAVDTLRSLGYEVLVASSGASALAVAQDRDGPIDLLLTDVIMPGMNGREVAARIAALRPGIKVLYTSGYTNDIIANHGVLVPGVRFLAKPYGLDALARHVREVLDEA